MYSSCKMVNKTPLRTVKSKRWVVCEWLFSISLWCLWWAHVPVTPKVKRIAVFDRWVWKRLNKIIPAGGSEAASSIAGNRLLWKKVEKNLTINKISDKIKLFLFGVE